MKYAKQRGNTGGFTLIELVMVILILGILAVRAVPRYVGFASDAKAAALQGISGSLGTVVNLVQSKAMIMGLDSVQGPTTMTFDGISITVYNGGVPREIWFNGFEQLMTSSDFHYIGGNSSFLDTVCEEKSYCIIDNLQMSNVIAGRGGWGLFFFPNGHALSEKDCFAYYTFELSGFGGSGNGGVGTLESMEVNSVTHGC
ncbi:type II secretion system protein [Echinimonas agarilytica]|uniref:type II secretion system protein n=1 Tax=Echinimonas agarilytica TaxID=1215918 RepID=UPI0025582B01|nr:type II secretion system protein [Echinimonas agarilytica]